MVEIKVEDGRRCRKCARAYRGGALGFVYGTIILADDRVWAIVKFDDDDDPDLYKADMLEVETCSWKGFIHEGR